MKIKYSNVVMGLLLPLSVISANELPLTPPNAVPGECYARVLTPATYDTIEENVLIKEATEEIKISPAVYETVEKEVEVVPALKKLIPVPAKYKDTIETIEVKSAQRIWKTSLKKKAIPVSNALLSTIKSQGVELDNVPAGTCYKEYFRPQTYKTIEEDVIVQDERSKTEVIPAEFDLAEEKIVIVPSSKKVVEIPALYNTIEEKVLIEDAKTVWKKGQNPAQKLTGSTGEIMCLVKVPAKYKTVKKSIVTTPASTTIEEIPAEIKMVSVKKVASQETLKHTPIPAVHKTIKKKVLDSAASFVWSKGEDKPWRYTGHMICLVETPAITIDIKKKVLATPETVKEETIPAVFKTVKVKKLISPAKEVRTPIPAEFKVVEKRKKTADVKMAWQRILCQTNMTKDVIKKIQIALGEKSYRAGKPDGVLGRGTRNALEQFQKDNGLATGGITYETLNALNIEL